MIVRYEAWGAWVKLDAPPALVAIDRDAARAMGLDGGEAWTEGFYRPRPIEVHLAVTAKCAAGCEGCYLDARPDGEEPPIDTILRRLDALAAARVLTVAFGGGEPLTRDDLPEIAAAARARGIAPVLTTSGLGMTRKKAESLRAFAQVNVSFDGEGDDYAKVRGWDGARTAERAIDLLRAAGVTVGVNVVLTRATFDALPRTIARAIDRGAREAQLLRYKPAGRAASLDYLARRLSPAQVASFGATLRALARSSPPGFHLRIDCALVPFLSADAELYADPDRVAAWGVMGCEAGSALAAVRVDGKVAPCSFAGPTELAGEALADGFGGDATLAAWRAWTNAPPEPCASCNFRPVCKGGCKVVASFAAAAHGPDPECPRVRSFREGA